jgi:tRNA/tmRNA/rRNA uracil-C5-methylase (TrmA/RlmC/RlmD family)
VILYVACGLEAFRDQAAQLVQGGYHVAAATGVDMFPHTSELELVARFERA